MRDVDTDVRGYFGWLINMVDGANFGKEIVCMLHQLYSLDFTFSIQNDENRMYDGLGLRHEFYEAEADDEDDIFKVPVSVLEVLIAFSRRISVDVLGDYSADHRGTKKWFWLMLENLGIMKDGKVCGDKGHICGVVVRWLERDFSFNGEGSLFPLRDNSKGIDQRKIEIWQQFCLYLAEHPELE